MYTNNTSFPISDWSAQVKKPNRVKRVFRRLTSCLIFLVLGQTLVAQLTGIKTIPGDYPNFIAAVAALNLQGVGPGGVIFDIDSNRIETGVKVVLSIPNNPPAADRPLVFRKKGTGNNPRFEGATGVSTASDGIIVLNGLDYVTFDGIDLSDTRFGNNNVTTRMEWGFAFLKKSSTDGCHHNTIKNCNISLHQSHPGSHCIYVANHTVSNTTPLVLTSFDGTNSYNHFYNNTLENCFTGYHIVGYQSPSPFDLYDIGNEIGVDGQSTHRSSVTKFGSSSNSGNGRGVWTLYQNNLKVSHTYINNSGGLPLGGDITGIYIGEANNANIDVFNDTITIFLYSSIISNTLTVNSGVLGTGNTINVHHNLVTGCQGNILIGYAISGGASYLNIHHNELSNNTNGRAYGIRANGSNGLPEEIKMYDNVVFNNSTAGFGYTGYSHLFEVNGNTKKTSVYNNLAYNNVFNTSGGLFGCTVTSNSKNDSIYNNQIYDLIGGSGLTIGMQLGGSSGSLNAQVFDNTIHTISGAGKVGGILADNVGDASIAHNNVYDLASSLLIATSSPTVYGIGIGPGAYNYSPKISNNFVSDLRAPNCSSNSEAIYGIWAQGIGGAKIGIYNNTVFLDASSTSSQFGTAGIVMSASPTDIDLRNNIVINQSTSGTTSGRTVAVRRANSVLDNYALTSNHNCFYAGTPGPKNLIFYDGNNADQTIDDFKDRVGPREQSSFSENVAFVNSNTAPFDLHIDGNIATQCESGGSQMSAIIEDFDRQPRFPILGFPTNGFVAAPDVGADEFGGVMNDIAAPSIQFDLLSSDSVATARALPFFATITDPSGVNTNLGTKPRIYYKRATDTDTIIDNTNTSQGWKYAEATNGSSPFSFVLDYTKLIGGSVTAGDDIQYFVTAQDLNAIPNVGMNSGGFSTEPNTVALVASNFPLSHTIHEFNINGNLYAGVIPVGPTELINSLTNTGGAFDLLNSGVLTGNVTLTITGDLLSEMGQIALYELEEIGGSGYSVSIVPSAPSNRLITGGATFTQSMIKFSGADRILIDGRFSGAGQYLTLRNSSNSRPAVIYVDGSQDNVLRNCIIESSNTDAGAYYGGAVRIGGTVGLEGNNNNYIGYNEFRDRSDVIGNPTIFIFCQGTYTYDADRQNHGCVIEHNQFHDWYYQNSPFQNAIDIRFGNSGFTISNNSFYQTAPRANTSSNAKMNAIKVTSAYDADGGYKIENNYIGGTAPLLGGSDMTLSSSSSLEFAGINVQMGQDTSFIQNNSIGKINFTCAAPNSESIVFAGILVKSGNINIGTSNGNLISAISTMINAGGSGLSQVSGICAPGPNGRLNANTHNNTIQDWAIGGSTSSPLLASMIDIRGNPLYQVSIKNNLIGSTTLPNSILLDSINAPTSFYGIKVNTYRGESVLVDGNTIQNIRSLSTDPNTFNIGIQISHNHGSLFPAIVTHNILKDIVGQATPLSENRSTIGISIQGIAAKDNLIAKNTVSGLSNEGTGLGFDFVTGFHLQNMLMGGTVTKNKLFDLNNLQTGSASGITGFNFKGGDGWTVSNNMISLMNRDSILGTEIVGIEDNGSNEMNFYYNSVHVGGYSNSASNSYAYLRNTASHLSSHNNLFYNQRSGGTGTHYSVGNLASSPNLRWFRDSISYNAYIGSDFSKIGDWSVSGGLNFAQWKDSSGTDVESYSASTTMVPASNLFIDPPNGNLNINPANNICWYLNGKGIAGGVSGNNADDFGAIGVRSTTLGNPTDIGAHEFSPNIGVAPIPATASSAPALGTTTTYSFGGRRLGELIWGATGTVPSGIVWTYFSSIPPPAAPGTNINSYWDVAASGGNGFTYDLKSYYTIAEQNALLDNTLNLGKRTNASPWYYLTGSTASNNSGKFLTKTGLNTFAQFTLGDSSATSYTILATITGGAGTISPSGSVSVPPFNNQSFSIVTGSCEVVDSVFVDSMYVGNPNSYDFAAVDTNHVIHVKLRSIALQNNLSITASTSDTICANTIVNFTAAANNPGSSPIYVWKKNGSPVGSNLTTYSDNGLANGDTITCELTVADSCVLPNPAISNGISFVVDSILSPAVNITASPSTVICIGLPVTFTATPTHGGIAPSFQWYKNNIPVGANASTYFDNGLASSDVIYCDMSSSAHCVTTVTNSSNALTITLQPALAINPIPDTTICGYGTICAGDSNGVAHANLSGGCSGYSYIWSNGETSPSASNLYAGIFSVTVSDTTGTMAVGSVNITSPPSMSVTIDTLRQSCVGDSSGLVEVSAAGGNDCAPYTFLWSNGAMTKDLANVPSGSYTVTITDAAGCTITETVVVNSFQNPLPVFTQVGNTLVSSQQWPSYQWLLNGTAIIGANADTLPITLSGNYALQVTDTNGCRGTTLDMVIVGLDEHIGSFMDIFLYPNPALESFAIQTRSPISYGITIEILDLFGRKLVRHEANELETEVSLDIRNFAAGTYVVKVMSEYGEFKLFRLVVE